MAKWLIIKNNTKIHIDDIPLLTPAELREELIVQNKRPIGFFGQKDNESIKLFVLLGNDEKGEIFVSSAIVDANNYESLTNQIPAFHIFEREFYEEFGIEPLNHPWLKPLRKNQNEYDFLEVEGDEIHQVAVGPIHAGVIEPGHFRFMCHGELVYHLEIMLGYQHRGCEKLMVKNPSNQLAESICGDSVIAYNIAYSQVMEALKDIKISDKAQLIRKIALEMERIGVHIGDMGAISGDIAYLMGASVFGATRTLVINTTLQMCGSRFGRGFIGVGGVNFDLSEEVITSTLKTLDKVEKDVERMTKAMLKNSTVMSRLEKTGTVSFERAKEIGLVGMPARACGINLDSRFDFPDKWMKELKFENKPFKGKGDVNARFKLRYKEIMQSISMVRTLLKKLCDYKNDPILTQIETNNFDKNSLAVSIVEGWRGEVVHIAITDSNGQISKYKIKDPSFNNWYGLALAVRNNGVSDFPLCNKSFNLSYSGNDL